MVAQLVGGNKIEPKSYEQLFMRIDANFEKQTKSTMSFYWKFVRWN